MVPTPPSDGSKRLAVMDGLRGLAIFLVFWSHSFLTGYRPGIGVGSFSLSVTPLVFGGSLGVELFFFISGFVLFVPYARAELEKRREPTLGHFIDRRFIKIVPSYYLALAAVLAFFNLSVEDENSRPWQILTHLTFTHSFWRGTFAKLSGGVFWTLAIEVQFYVLFPLIATFMRRRPLQTYAFLVAIAAAYRLWLDATGRNYDYFWVLQLPDQIDLFAAGMLAAYVYVKFGHRTAEARVRAWATAAAVLATAALLWLMNDFSDVTQAGGIDAHSVWENDNRFAVSITIAAVALGSLFAQGWWRAIVACPPLVWLSTISYNLYLWHDSIVTQCQVSGFPCAGRATPWASIDPWNQQYFVGYAVVSIAIATLMTYAVERPLLKLGTRGAYERFIRDPLRALAIRAASRPP